MDFLGLLNAKPSQSMMVRVIGDQLAGMPAGSIGAALFTVYQQMQSQDLNATEVIKTKVTDLQGVMNFLSKPLLNAKAPSAAVCPHCGGPFLLEKINGC